MCVCLASFSRGQAPSVRGDPEAPVKEDCPNLNRFLDNPSAKAREVRGCDVNP